MRLKKLIILTLSAIITLSVTSCNTDPVHGSAINIDDKYSSSSDHETLSAIHKESISANTTRSSSTSASESRTATYTSSSFSSASTAQTNQSAPTVRKVLQVKNIQQMPELPSGCEVVCAAMLLQYYGFECSKTELLEYMPIVESPDSNGRWVTPWEAFVGNPRSSYFGCYYPVIEKTINSYFKAKGISGYTVNGSFQTSLSDLYKEIDKGNPVIIWTSINMVNITTNSNSWIVQDGSTCNWTTNEHCVVLMGYDRINDTLIVSDPLDARGTVEYPRKTVEKVYNQMYKQAVLIQKKP